MGYVASKGGLSAIRAAEQLVRRARLTAASNWLHTDQVIDRLRLSVDRVMGEGGVWDEELAARAFRQAEGDIIEASHLVRAYRATMPRLGYTTPVSMDRLEVLRRIVPAYREVPGPQLLGRTVDYTGRLIETADDALLQQEGERLSADHAAEVKDATAVEDAGGDDRRPARLLDLLRAQDLAVDRRRLDDPDPVDISRQPPRPGMDRSALLSVMARAETGALVNLWYRNILGPDRYLHEVTLGEVRHGRLPVEVVNPLTGNEVVIGQVRVTEVEAIEDLDGMDEDRTHFDVGYGLCLGHNERKAIAMANLDIAMSRSDDNALEQSVVLTSDGLDASGFLEHLKLPHYVTFRSMTERKLAMRSERAQANRRTRTAATTAEDLPVTETGEPVEVGA
jgi:alpha-D-ribose 1-methylphosphonate 5-triphosphate synthase subunit PhnI